jgi:hypothetical protein
LAAFFGVEYGEDWEMWIRIAAHYPVAFSPTCLAMYRRDHATNISNKSITTGKNLRDLIKVIDTVQKYLPDEKRKETREAALRNFSISYARSSYRLYKNNKDTALALTLAKQAFRVHKNIRTFYWIMRFMINFIFSKLFQSNKTPQS